MDDLQEAMERFENRVAGGPMEEIALTLTPLNNLEDSDKYLNELCGMDWAIAKFSTTNKVPDYDRRQTNVITAFKGIKIALRDRNGILILMGNVEIDFTRRCGNFFLTKVLHETTAFEKVHGVSARIRFLMRIESGQATPTNEMYDFLAYLNSREDFVYNISQFDEFMEVFNFYKKMSNALNNTISYKVTSSSDPYYFINVGDAEIDSKYILDTIYDNNGVLKGYKVNYVALSLISSDDLLSKILYVIDYMIEGGEQEISKIRRIGSENVYLSNFSKALDKNIKELREFEIINICQTQKGELTLTGQLKNDDDYEAEFQYVNLYDMGQKIKVDSIDNSLRLINKGATGPATELLEYLIGDKEMPNNPRPVVDEKIEPYLRGLNESQKQAFLMAVDGSPVSLIKGPPGTGKTHVINAIVQYITKELGQKVVVSSQTHVAIDNVLDKLMENHDLVVPKRITNRRNKYSDKELDRTLYKTWGNKFSQFNELATDKDMKENVQNLMNGFKGDERFTYSERTDSSDYSVIGATTTTSAIAGKKGLEVLDGFDWLIIDEVSKCPITEVLRYLPYVSKIIMVGDDFQLSPLLEFNKEDVMNIDGYDEDEFDKLKKIYEDSVFAKVMDKAKKSNRLVLLNENYRSVKQVLTTYNVFYDGQLRGYRETIRPEKVSFKVTDPLYDFNRNDVFFVDVRHGQEVVVSGGTSRYNVQEAAATAFMLEKIMETVENPKSITAAAIFPYAGQINYFQKHYSSLINQAKKLFKNFEIDTVDAFQGRESDIVLVNTVVADQRKRNFLNDFRRINVSMSRARDKLFIFGNPIVLSSIEMRTSDNNSRKYFEEIVEYIRSLNSVIVYKG